MTAMSEAVKRNAEMSEGDQVAYDLYGASFAEVPTDARFLLLMMAIETMIEPEPRAAEVQAHVEALRTATKDSDLSDDEIRSIYGTLQYLRNASIGQAGRKLASRLGDRTYADKTPERFFSKCYELRSALVHGGHPRPSRAEVSSLAAPLETFVGDLLGIELLDVEFE